MTPEAVYRLARSAGLDGDSAVIATAIAWAESGLNPDAIGDENLEDEKWGPSVGLWQVRSLRADAGTGRARDRMRLQDPAFNAAAMATISGGSDWSPWSVWKSGRYRQYLNGVADALIDGEETPMQEWMPGVEHVDRGGSTPVQSDGPTVIVLHTTETAGRASYAGTEPHFEVDRDGSILQYISIARTAKALYNAPGGGETNRRRGRIIQFELVNRAAEVEGVTDAQLDGMAEAMRFVDDQLPFAKMGPAQGFHGADEGIYPYLASEDSPIRFSRAAWEAFGGICGHQHVIENDHWDPGAFPLARLLTRLGVSASPQPQEDDDMLMVFDYNGPDKETGVWITDGIIRRPTNDPAPYLNAGAKHRGEFNEGQFRELADVRTLVDVVRSANDVDSDAVAEAVVAKMGDALAAKVLDRLRDRLAS